MSSLCWITSQECSSSSIAQCSSEETSVSTSAAMLFRWLRFVFLSPCPQTIIFSAIDVLFLATLVAVFCLQKLYSSRLIHTSSHPINSSIDRPLLDENRRKSRTRSRFMLSLVLTALLTVSCTVLFILDLTGDSQAPGQAVFWLVHAITHLGILLVLVAHQIKLEAVPDRLVASLRLYWVANFILVSLLAASSIIRYVSFGGDYDSSMKRDDVVVSFVLVPISLLLFAVAVRGSSSGIDDSNTTRSDESDDSSSLLDAAANVTTGYASASLLSKATWTWLSPLLSKGYKSPLEMDQVPSLSPDHQAEKMAELFETNWPKPEENSKNPLRTTLIRCFWKDLVLTGCLAVAQLLFLYVGPVLITRFVDFFAAGRKGKSNHPYEGHYLVLILLCAEVAEVLSSHQFNFHSEKLSMLMQSSVITFLYKKGLKLSCSSRQAHGVGAIVSYMAVDAQQISDLMLHIHSFWLMPCQAAVALLLLYVYIGVSAFAALAIACAATIFSVMCTHKNNQFQHSMMRNRDSRLKATNEMLSNMRVIKFQAWEEHFHRKIKSFRDKEYAWLSKFTYSFSLIFSVLSAFTILQSALVFGVAILVGTKLDPGRVFTVTTVLKILEGLVRNFPQALVSVTQALISLGRLESFLISNELDLQSVEWNEGCDSRSLLAIEVKDGSFSWDDEGEDAVLNGVNVEIRKGELVAIVGTVGSGKSSLLAAVLGEMHKKSGKVRVCGTTAYVAQTSWIQNATIRENILFGSPMNKDKYNQAIRVCCLEKDLEMMEHGDQTEIGERGINLSGGQKQRIQLARAVYQDCDIYLLDDIFSAVDAHTGSDIFKDCVRGALKDKTILLVTHQLDFLHNANQILVMRDGMIVQSGEYQDLLLSSGSDFAALVAAYETSMELVVKTSSTASNDKSNDLPRVESSKPLERSESEKGTSKLIEEEERETGNVSSEVYKQYCTEAYGWWGVGAVILVSLFWQASVMGGDYWLAYETAETTIFNPSLFMTVYLIIAGVTCLFIFTRYFTVAYLGLVTAHKLFNQIIHSTLHAPMSFFDTTPSGRILSRASSDQASVDMAIPILSSMTLMVFFSLVGILAVTCINAWPTVFLLVPLFFLNLWYRGYYIASSRELTRLGSITRAPVIHHFSETLSGVMTIRCFEQQKMFFKGNVERVNANLRMGFHNNAANEWLGFRLELIGVFFLCTATLFMVTVPGIIRAEYVGMTLSYGLALNGMMFYTVHLSCNVENQMIAVERIKQFIRTPAEAAWTIPGCLPSPNWPTRGQIEIKDLQVRYRSNTPVVLRGVSVHIRGGEKIGVVGRTGSGKSTLIQVFFRLVEPCGGIIEIDGVDICKLGLHDLRSKFGIIPQDPVLFEGTVRSNIDPIGLYSDDDIWKSLERCQLKDVVAAKPEKLDASVVDNGENWSVGQRQLLCLGRVLLKRSKILFMDEATASVDSQTDDIIQKIIREDFSTCTIISIAHRIPTVMDCDKVLVMDDGRVKEFDAPSRLLERHSLFGALVQEYSNRSEI